MKVLLNNPTVKPIVVSKPVSTEVKVNERPSVKELVRVMEASKHERWIRPVSFSLLDPIEAQLCDHASKHSSFSAYVKRLILKDMQ